VWDSLLAGWRADDASADSKRTVVAYVSPWRGVERFIGRRLRRLKSRGTVQKHGAVITFSETTSREQNWLSRGNDAIDELWQVS